MDFTYQAILRMHRRNEGSSIVHEIEGGTASLVGHYFCCTDNFVIYELSAVKQFLKVEVIT